MECGGSDGNFEWVLMNPYGVLSYQLVFPSKNLAGLHSGPVLRLLVQYVKFKPKPLASSLSMSQGTNELFSNRVPASSTPIKARCRCNVVVGTVHCHCCHCGDVCCDSCYLVARVDWLSCKPP